MADLSRDEAREMRDTGRRAMEQVARVAREAAAQAGMSRTFARVSKVNADGTLQLELGSDLHPMPLYSVRMTTACAAAQPGDTVVVDTYAHVPLATGVVHTAGSADHLVPEHSQDASTIASGTLNPARLPPATTSSPGAVSVGGGLKVSGGRLSVDNWAYVKKLVESSTEWAYIWSNAESDRFVRWRVLMGICYVEAIRVNDVGSHGWKAGTIPDSALPSHSLYTAACDWHRSNTAQIWVGGLSSTDSRGEVWLYNNGTDDVYGSASWPIDM